MDNPFFTVIIPVYNIARYLEQCIQSVLNQSFTDYEILLVDDGAVDSSATLCDCYCLVDNRVRAIHKANGGLSSARNTGIKAAVGKYLLFLDGDDYWEDTNSLQNLYEVMRNQLETPDVVSFASTLLFPNGSLKKDSFSFSTQYFSATIENLEYLIRHNMIIGSACTKAVRRDFLLANDLFFKEGIKSEDIEWIFRLSCLLPKYLYVDIHFYVYRKNREGSISNTVGIKHITQYLSTIADFCNDNSIDGEVKNIFLNYVSYHYAIVCAFIENMKDKRMRSELLRDAKRYSYLFTYDAHPQGRKVSFLYKIAGYRMTVFALGMYLQYRK